ncbi:MAG: PAS domain-containing sensor histidine kinase [Chloroflexota bacterium]
MSAAPPLAAAPGALGALARLAHQGQREADPGGLCRLYLSAIVRDLDYAAGFVALVNRTRGTVEGQASLNFSDELVQHFVQSVTDQSALRMDVTLGDRPVLLQASPGEPGLPLSPRALVLDAGLGAVLALPLFSGGEDLRCCRGAQAPGDWRETFGPACLSCYRYPVEGLLIVASRAGDVVDLDALTLRPFADQLGAGLAKLQSMDRMRSSLEALEGERDWLLAVVENVPDPVLLTDVSNTILLENQKARELFAMADDDSEGRKQACSLNNFLLSLTLSAYSLDDRPQPRELTLVDPIEGRDLLYEIVSHRARSPRTGEVGVVSVLRNVTDLKLATEELRSSFERVQELDQQARKERQRLNLVIQNVADPVIVTDVSNDVLLMNERAERLFSTAAGPGALAGTSASRRHYEANDARFTSFLSQMRIETGATKSGELELAEPDTGELLSMAVTSGEIEDERGEVNAVISILHDLTEVRELERRQLRDQLFESEKLAATGRLAASIAHEINNPLEAIKNALYLLARTSQVGPGDRKFLEIANAETQRVSNIIQEMLGFYRPSLTPGAIDVSGLLEDVLVLLEKQLRQHAVIVQRDFKSELPAVLGHVDQLKQVFLNLILNGQDAMPAGGELRIRTSAAREKDGAGHTRPVVRLAFTDRGSGILREHLPHVFEPFFSTKGSKGTGLGLWVSLGIVQAHSGNITVTSKSGQGTTFMVTLPAAAQA